MLLPVIVMVMYSINRDESIKYLCFLVCRCGSNRFHLSACENGGGVDNCDTVQFAWLHTHKSYFFS